MGYFIYPSTNLHAQNSILKHYDSDDGLRANMVYYMLQDPKGFLWIATDNGVYRFDGDHFKRFSTENGLPDNDILSMIIDNNGRIWLSTFNNNIFCIENEFVHDGQGGKNFRKYESYSSFAGKQKDRIFFQIRGSYPLQMIRPNGEIIRISERGPHLVLPKYLINVKDEKIKLKNNQFKLLDSIRIPKSKKKVNAIHRIDDTHGMIIGEDQYFIIGIQNNRLNLSILPIGSLKNAKQVLFQDELWFLFNQQIFPLNNKGKLDSTRSITTLDFAFNSFFLDHHEDIWFFTKGDGIYYWPKLSMLNINETNGLMQANLAAAHMSEDILHTISIQGHFQSFKGSTCISGPKDISAKCPGRINNILSNHQYIIFGSDIGNLLVMNLKTGQEWKVDNIGSIKHLSFFSDEEIILSTSNNTMIMDFKQNQRTILDSGRSVTHLKMNDSSYIISKVNEIVIIKLRKNLSPEKTRIPTGNITVSAMAFQDGVLAFSTFQNGLYLFRERQLININADAGFIDNHCSMMLIENKNSIWVATPSGINHVIFSHDGSDFKIEHITSKNGLPSDNIKGIFGNSHFMYAIGPKGISLFSPTTLRDEFKTPDIHITSFESGNKKFRQFDVAHRLKADEKITIRFSGIDFRSFGNLRYFYKLVGLDQQWHETKNKELVFERLQPGKYEFLVYAMNSGSKKSIQPARLSFYVEPKWWQQTAIIVLMILAGIVVITVVSRQLFLRRYRKKLTEERIEKQLSELELKAIKAQINPHFIFNTLNAIQYFISNQENDRAVTYLNQMSKLIRSTLDYSNEVSIALREEISYLKTYLDLESLRFEEDEFYYLIDNTLSPEEMELMIPTMVLQPHIENAVRHGLKPKKGNNKQLILRFYRHQSEIFCEIEDNGIGREASARLKEESAVSHMSQGKKLSASKLEIYHKQTGKQAAMNIRDKMIADKACGTLVQLIVEI
jgi:hypothetical protein